ncbi:MAG: class I SAM-dependent methyltransferase [Sphaerochaetaceae bacterium]|nr:class I SAM-dependent methyltransferase [Sphaerochaetaceae bacterium]
MNRMEFWTPDMIRFMQDAAEKTQYFSFIAQRVRSLCPQAHTVCDAGCGTGSLSLKLSELFDSVTGADINRDAVQALKSQAERKNISNIRPLCCNLIEDDRQKILGNGNFDVMVFSFFGRIGEALAIARRLGCKKIVIVRRNYRNHRFSLSQVPLDSSWSKDYREELEGLKYSVEDFEIEFGQPFRSLEDAARFYEIYSRDTDRSLLTRENIEALLEKTGDVEFPYYLRKNRKCLLISVDLT